MSVKILEHPDFVAPHIVAEAKPVLEVDPCRDGCTRDTCEGCPHFQPESIEA